MAFFNTYKKSSQVNLGRFFILFGLALLVSCSNSFSEAKEMVELTTNSLNETGKNVEILFTEDAFPSIKILAPEAIRVDSEKPYTEFTKGMELYVYGEEGIVESVLTADYGKMNDGSTEMIAKGNVVVINETGEQLKTEELVWDQDSAKIHSKAFVTITTPTEIIQGNGFEANDNFSEYTIFDITGTVDIESDEF